MYLSIMVFYSKIFKNIIVKTMQFYVTAINHFTFYTQEFLYFDYKCNSVIKNFFS